VTVPEAVNKLIRRFYDNAYVVWNNRKSQYELWEKVDRGPRPGARKITTYRNHDGSMFPIIGDRCVEILQKCDVRLWPLEARMAMFDREDAEARESKEREMSERRKTIVMEDYNYLFGVPTFFMDPSSMPEARSKMRPSQERAYKAGISRGEA